MRLCRHTICSDIQNIIYQPNMPHGKIHNPTKDAELQPPRSTCPIKGSMTIQIPIATISPQTTKTKQNERPPSTPIHNKFNQLYIPNIQFLSPSSLTEPLRFDPVCLPGIEHQIVQYILQSEILLGLNIRCVKLYSISLT